ncbi:MAG: flagellar hook protein FlgE [Pseudomonadota bacterium]
MSISSSLFSGVSGLASYGNSMAVIGDNIANVNTIGFKGSSATFEDALSQSIATAGGTYQLGRGVMLSAVTASFAQGSFESTDQPTDLAIGGKGFFIVKNADTGNVYYSRAGHFRYDVDGNFVNPVGLVAQGWSVQENTDGSISTVGAIGDVVLSSNSSDPQATTTVTEAVNLDSTATAPSSAFSLNGATGAASNYNYITSLNVYDSLGETHAITIYFTKTSSSGVWKWNAVVGSSDSYTGSYEVQASGTLTFNSSGVLTAETLALSGCLFDFTGGAAQNQTVDFQYGTQSGAVSKSTQYSSASTTVYQNQDGYGSGSLEQITVDPDGVIGGHYSNGQIIYLNKIALASFQNPWGLTKRGGSLYSESRQSGQAITGPPGTAGMGKLSPNSLEQSNVDIASEFVRMIITQRAFQANSRIITTADDMLAELINLKR